MLLGDVVLAGVLELELELVVKVEVGLDVVSKLEEVDDVPE